ncbi:PTS sugar transporter subunit IIA [Enterococcus sp. HY326]|uniref:PTS sugar transporter subunit IIA n=1 Tax=Enterococcus sp. HY326 TaxID=2971265 RepID=UPI00223FEC76|nr:PTS N-acetylglucosamine transporter subunit IIBC [Enterococcus sp. HY326]
MRKFLIATHRSMAEGIKDTVNFFTGSTYDISTLSAYMDNNELRADEINDFIPFSTDDELVVFTDIASGSVTQKFYPYLKQENIFLVSGINLPIVLSIVLATDQKLSYQKIDELIGEAKEQIVQIKLEETVNIDDE